MKDAFSSLYEIKGTPEMIIVRTIIFRNKLKRLVYCKKVPKHYAVVYNKRVVK